jgi:hypothetical protein
MFRYNFGLSRQAWLETGEIAADWQVKQQRMKRKLVWCKTSKASMIADLS